MRSPYLALLLLFIYGTTNSQCLVDDLPLDINIFNQTFEIEVTGATNAILGQNGQSVESVDLTMFWDFPNYSFIRITAPDGSNIVLSQTGLLEAFYDVTFTGCGQPTDPNGCYTEDLISTFPSYQAATEGVYYPQGGCLSDLTGDINGTWLFECDFNGTSDDAFIDCIKINFSDVSGIECIQQCDDADYCYAYGGIFSYENYTVVPGSSDLLLSDDFNPDYGCYGSPDPELVGILYVIYDLNIFTIIEISTDADLTDYPEGTYQVQQLVVDLDDISYVLSLDLPLDYSTFISTTADVCYDLTIGDITVTISTCIFESPFYFEFNTISEPEGSQSLVTDWTPIFADDIDIPDPSIWDEVWVVVDQTSFVIIAYLDSPDFSSLPPGDYYIYLMYYWTVDGDELLPIDGVNTLSDLNIYPYNSQYFDYTLCGNIALAGLVTVTESCTLDLEASLEEADLTYPQGDPALDPDWEITYNSDIPDSDIYGFYFVLLEEGTDLILEYLDSDDFTALEEGEYYVIALWYRISDTNLLPAGNGLNTLMDLIDLIDSEVLCASIFGNNEVTVLEPCLANGGQFDVPNISTCEGSAELEIVLNDYVEYPADNPPDTDEYDYLFVMIQDGEIVDFLEDPNLTSLAVGTYQICGLSIQSSDTNDLPDVGQGNAVFDIQSLIDQSVICADLSDGCFELEIVPAGQTLFSGPLLLCAGQVYEYIIDDFTGNVSDYIITGDVEGLSLNSNGIFEFSITDGPVDLCVGFLPDDCILDSCMTIDLLPYDQLEISGQDSPCINTNETYTLSYILPVGDLTFDVQGGTFISYNSGDIEVEWGDDEMGSITIEYQVGDCNYTVEYMVTLLSNPDLPIVDLPSEGCTDSSITISNPTDPPIGEWMWTSDQAVIEAQGNNVSFTYTDAGTYEIMLTLVGAQCGNLSETYVIEILDAPSPMILDLVSSCQLDFSLTAMVTDGNTYVWSSPTGDVIFNNPNDEITNASVGNPGTYTVVFTEINGSCETTVEQTIELEDGLQYTPLSYICDGDNNYTVMFDILTGSAPYFVNEILITGNSFESESYVSGSTFEFQIEDSEGCTAYVNGQHGCACISYAGTMSNEDLMICIDENLPAIATHFGDEILDDNDILRYALHSGDGGTIIDVIAINDTGVFFFDPSTMELGQPYFISVVVGNPVGNDIDLTDECLSAAIGQAVTFYSLPEIDLGNDIVTCNNNILLDMEVLDGTWSIVSTPANGNAIIDVTNDPSSLMMEGAGVYRLSYSVVSGSCTESDEIDVTFTLVPVADDFTYQCDDDTYTVTFDISGGTPPYSVEGTTITGTSFTSESIPSNNSYQYIIIDEQGCQSEVIFGAHDCDCISYAGTMILDTILFCTADDALIVGDTDASAVLDQDDIQVFILHDGSQNVIGDILEVNDIPEFVYMSDYGTDSTLYIASIVGNLISDTIDFDDPCIDISAGQPIIISEYVQAVIESIDITCDRIIMAEANSGGLSGTWTIIEQPMDSEVIFLDENDPQSEIIVNQSGVYSFAWNPISDFCVGGDTATIIMIDELAIDSFQLICLEDSSGYIIDVSLVGGVSPYYYNGSEIDGDAVIDTIDSGMAYDLLLSDDAGCTINLSGTKICACDNESGILDGQLITSCLGDTITMDFTVDPLLSDLDTGIFVVFSTPHIVLDNIIEVFPTHDIYSTENMADNTVVYVSYVTGSIADMVSQNFNEECILFSNFQPIVFRPNASVNLNQEATICTDNYSLTAQVSSDIVDLDWQMVDVSTNVSIDFATIDQYTISIDNLTGGEYFIIATIEDSDQYCIDQARDTTVVTVTNPLAIEDIIYVCDGANYTAQILLSGGTLPYIINGAPTVGSDYGISDIASGTTVSLTIQDSGLCDDINVTLDYQCTGCFSDPGEMTADTVRTCAYEEILITTDNELIEEGSSMIYVLHRSATDSIFDPIDTSSSGSFSFKVSDMSYDLLYYISAVVYDTQFLDYDDVCTISNVGTPVLWHQESSATIDIDSTVCLDQDIDLMINFDGQVPATLYYSDAMQVEYQAQINNSGQSVIALPFINTDQINVDRIIDANGCQLELEYPNFAFEIAIIEPPKLGEQLVDYISICVGELAEIFLFDYISDYDQGRWSNTGGVDVDSTTGVVLLTDDDIGSFAFTYTVDGGGICIDTELTITVDIQEPEELTLNIDDPLCFGGYGEVILMDANGELISEFFIYDQNDAYIQPTDLTGGEYRLAYIDSNGCTFDEEFSINNPLEYYLDLGSDMIVDEGSVVFITPETNILDEEISFFEWLINANQFGGPIFDTLQLVTEGDALVTLTITDSDGCIVSDDLSIIVNSLDIDIVLPNIFNPNNSVFRIPPYEKIDVIKRMAIYSRWGEEIYSKSDFDPKVDNVFWDGTANGMYVGNGVFVYIIDFIDTDGVHRLIRGDVTVIR